jgi:hypothetical protein
VRAASAPFDNALAARWTRRRAAAELRRLSGQVAVTLDEPIQIVDHDPRWFEEYRSDAAEIEIPKPKQRI